MYRSGRGGWSSGAGIIRSTRKLVNNPAFKAIAMPVIKSGYNKFAQKNPGAAKIIDIVAPTAKRVLNAIETTSGNTFTTSTKGGFMPIPGAKAGYARALNKGTGLSTTNYTFGKAINIPKGVRTNGYKCNYIVSNVDENFNIENPSTVFKGVKQYITANDATLQALITAIGSDATIINVSTSDETANMYLSNISSEITITSATNLNCSLRIYECVAKRDTNIANYRTPIDAWKNGIDKAEGSQDDTFYQAIGIYPSNSPFFRDYWIVDAYYDVPLGAGKTHIHKSTYNTNMTIPYSFILNHGGSAVLSGLTRAYLFVLSSSPIHDSTNESNVALGLANVDINIVQNYEYYAIPYSSQRFTFSLGSDAIANSPEVVADSDLSEVAVVN